jgi:hypothetical protein
MSFEIDHLFIVTDIGAAIALTEILADLIPMWGALELGWLSTGRFWLSVS